MVRASDYLVYRLDYPAHGQVASASGQFESGPMNESVVNRLFAGEPVRARLFLQFLRLGHRGIVIYRGNEWLGYGWSTTPQSISPPHLAGHVVKGHVPWIFYCHTREAYRGRGLYKHLLGLFVGGDVANGAANQTMYIDTSADNTPARRAIVAVGFAPYGVMRCASLRIPHVYSRVVFGRWDKSAVHPADRR